MPFCFSYDFVGVFSSNFGTRNDYSTFLFLSRSVKVDVIESFGTIMETSTSKDVSSMGLQYFIS